MPPPKETLSGVFFALAAFLFWGANPIYFKEVGVVPAVEVLAHRVVWAVPLLLLLVTLGRQWHGLRAALAERTTCLLLLASAGFISINWVVFIWAIAQDRVLEASLGYFINPLVNVLLGVLVLRERLRFWQAVAVGLAALGVLNLAWQTAGLPWVSLALAFSFGFYGLIRKMIRIGSVEGLLVETGLMLPLAIGYLVTLAWLGKGAFGRGDLAIDGLLLAAGIVTALPLLCYTSGARRLNYSTIGLFQYIAPSCHFLLAVLLYGEPFTSAHAVTFGCIWLGLALFSLDSLGLLRRRLPAA